MCSGRVGEWLVVPVLSVFVRLELGVLCMPCESGFGLWLVHHV